MAKIAAKTSITLHVRGAGAACASLRPALASSGNDAIAAAPAGFLDAAPDGARTAPLQHLLRVAESTGASILLSLSVERLARALKDGAERKALSAGLSRQRFLPVPAMAFATLPALLAPFEIADELRLDLELWRLAFLTQAFGRPPEDARRIVLSHADPASRLEPLDALPGGARVLLELDLDAIERGSDAALALKRLGDALSARAGVQFARQAGAPGWTDRMLRDVVGGNARIPWLDRGLPSARDAGFPFDLARAAAAGHAVAPSLAPHARALLEAEFDPARLEPDVARALLLRWLARDESADAAGDDLVERWTRCSFTTAALLLDQLARPDDTARPASPAPLSPALLREAVARCEQAIERAAAGSERRSGDAPAKQLTLARQALARARKLVPESESDLAAAQRVVHAALKTLHKVADARAAAPDVTANA